MTPRKETTQHAPLEGLLSRIRSRRIRNEVVGAEHVLDFGCGEFLHNLRAMSDVPRRYGLDIRFADRPSGQEVDGIWVGGSFEHLRKKVSHACIERVTALAVFEHLTRDVFLNVLGELASVTTATARIAATVPTPSARPVLEFLSFRLGLIDRSQIEDHQVYYDRPMLEETLASSPWRIERYSRFLAGMNSSFVMVKR